MVDVSGEGRDAAWDELVEASIHQFWPRAPVVADGSVQFLIRSMACQIDVVRVGRLGLSVVIAKLADVGWEEAVLA